MVYVDASHPELVDGFIRKTFTAMIEGIREPAPEPDGVFCYTFFKGSARVWPVGPLSRSILRRWRWRWQWR